MNISVRLFARARDLAGADSLPVELPDQATVGELRSALAAASPALAPLMPHLFVAVNEEYVSDDAVIPPGASVACFPPVSGG